MALEQPGAKAPYYPYIDGLRALAVLSVVVFHLEPSWLAGGFVGVDVFFVISGFVVSASLKDLQGKGLGTLLGHFYARRIKRIVPALIVCLLLTTLLAALFVPLSWLSVVNQQTGLYAFWGFSNFILAQSGRDYFAPTTEFNPYTHTWSLGVEEQFYLIFPLLFLGWLWGPKAKRCSLGLFGGLLLLSLGVAAWQSRFAPTDAYFLTPARLWELASGVLLYQLMSLYPSRFQWSLGVRLGVCVISLLLMCLSFIYSSAQGFPIPGALPSVLGTLGVIAALHVPRDVFKLQALLSVKPLVSVGKMSYSLYLWHWPIFVLFRWTYGLEALWLKGIALALTFALTFISWRCVENPIRHSGMIKKLPAAVVVVLGLSTVYGAWWTASWMTQEPHRFGLSTLSRNQDIWYPHGPSQFSEYPDCVADPQYFNVEGGVLMIYTPQGCQQQPPLKAHNLFVIGDSHALAYEGMFKQFSISQATRIYAYNNGGCPFISFQPGRDIQNAGCLAHTDAALRDIKNRIRAGDTLFLPSLRLFRFSDQWAYFGEEAAYKEMQTPNSIEGRRISIEWAMPILRDFVAQGVKVVFEAPKPIFRAPPFRCGDWFNRHNPICAHGFEVSRAELERYRAPVLDAMQTIIQQLPSVRIWDPFPTLCPPDQTQCSAWQGQQPLFLDGDHLSGLGNMKLLSNFVVFMNEQNETVTKP